jgi:hypothetical protein
MNAAPITLVVLTGLVLAACARPPDTSATTDSRTAEAAVIAAATPWSYGVESPYGEIVRIDMLWPLVEQPLEPHSPDAPRQDGSAPPGRYSISIMLESGELRTVVRPSLGNLRVGDQVRLFGEVMLRS